MNRVGHQPLIYSNEEENKKIMYVVSTLFVILAIGLLGFGFYLASLHNDWWVMFFLGPIVVVMGIIAIAIYPPKTKYLYQMALKEDGLYQHWHNKITNYKTDKFIPFHEVDQVLIGILSNHDSSQQNNSFYRFHALLIMIQDRECFFQVIYNQNELYEWSKRLYTKIANIYYTDYDLSKAYKTHFNSPVDFTHVPSSTENIVSEHIGTENYQNPFRVWQPDQSKIDIKNN